MTSTENIEEVKKSRIKNFTPRLNLIIGRILWLIVFLVTNASQKYKIEASLKEVCK
jgi:hypothetical protein